MSKVATWLLDGFPTVQAGVTGVEQGAAAVRFSSDFPTTLNRMHQTNVLLAGFTPLTAEYTKLSEGLHMARVSDTVFHSGRSSCGSGAVIAVLAETACGAQPLGSSTRVSGTCPVPSAAASARRLLN